MWHLHEFEIFSTQLLAQWRDIEIGSESLTRITFHQKWKNFARIVNAFPTTLFLIHNGCFHNNKTHVQS